MSTEEQAKIAAGERKYTELRPGAFEPARVADLDTERISQTVLYPTTLLGIAGVETDVAVAQCRAYNDWLADFCSHAPDRLFGIAIIPQQDVEAAAEEIRRASKVPNLVGTFIRPNPVVEWRHFHDPVYDPMYAGGVGCGLADRAPPVPRRRRAGSGRGAAAERGAVGSVNSPVPAPDEHPEHLLHAGDRQPGRPDDGAWRSCSPAACASGSRTCASSSSRRTGDGSHRGWSASTTTPRRSRGTCPTASCRRPSTSGAVHQLRRRRRDAGDRRRVAVRGADRIIWASDYPHPDAKFPGTVDELLENIGKLGAEAQQDIAWRNAAPLRAALSNSPGSTLREHDEGDRGEVQH